MNWTRGFPKKEMLLQRIGHGFPKKEILFYVLFFSVSSGLEISIQTFGLMNTRENSIPVGILTED
jgi:hypothetical protein